jgi:hypothetical protein
MERRLINFDRKPLEWRDRLRAIEPLVQLIAVPQGQQFPHLLPDGTSAWSIKDAVDWCAMHVERNPRTIRYWIAKFKAAGTSAFEPAPRSDKGTSRFFTQHRKAAILAAYLFLCLRPSARAVHEAIVRNRELIEVPEAKLPSCETVRRWLRSASPMLVAMALEGQRTYRELMFSDLERGLLAARKDWSE